MVDSVVGGLVRRGGLRRRILAAFGQVLPVPTAVRIATEDRGFERTASRGYPRRGSFRRTGCLFDSLREGDTEYAHLVDPHSLDRLELVRWQVMARSYGAHPRKTY